jgi:signal transduction histidine kinase/ligand-binding sensor domain-containing protein/DNA-binding response OmpR family regulator
MKWLDLTLLNTSKTISSRTLEVSYLISSMRALLKIKSIVFVFLSFCSVYGQHLDLGNLTFSNIEKGIPKMPISSIIEDHSGFIWIGTRGAGLYRFDGSNYYAYSYNALENSSLNSNLIYTTYLDSENNLWVGTNVGLNKYNRDLDTFERVPLKKNYLNDHQDINVKSLIEDANKNLIISTYNYGIIKLSLATHACSDIPLENDNTEDLFVNHLCKNKKGIIYAATSIGLRRINSKYDTLEKVIVSDSTLQSTLDTFIETIIFDDNDDLWAGTDNKGVLKLSHLEQSPKLEVKPVTNKRILSLNVFKNKILAGSENDGLLILDINGKLIKRYVNKLNDTKSLDSNSIWSLYIDRQHRLWVGYYNSGISVHDNYRNKFYAIQNLTNKNSLQGQSVAAIQQDRRGWYWIGVTGGLDIYKPKTNRYEHINASPNSKYKGLDSKSIQAVFIDSKENIWVGTWDKGLYFLKKGTKRFINYNKENTNGAIGSSGIMSFTEDSKGRIWMGSFLKGLHYFDPEKNTFSRCNSKPFIDNNLLNSDVKVVFADRNDVIWMGTTSGLYQIELTSSGAFKITSMRETMAKTIKNHPSIHDVLSIYQSNDNRIWIGTNGGGLFSYNTNTETLKSYNDFEGFHETSVNSIIEDTNNAIWIGGISGITNLNLKQKKAINYTVEDGLSDNYFNNSAVLKTKEGDLYFGGYSGINYFNPKHIETNTIPPKLYLSSLKLFNKDVNINAKNSPLEKVISQTDAITLKHNQSVFTLTYGSISYTLPEKNQYSYKLEGFDKSWNYVGKATSATYTNLPKGDYTFKLKAANNDGVWTTTPLAFKIRILPPWWKSLPAYIGMSVLFIITLVLISKFLKTRFQQRQLIEFEREKRLQEEHLNKKKLQFFTNISHEFRTPLTLIINPLEDIIKDETLNLPESVTYKHGIIRKNADRLSRLINELMDFRKLQLNKILVQAKEIDIISKVKDVLAYFEEEARQRRITINFQTSISSLKTWIDPGMLEKILFNILSNAFKITPDGGKIIILIKVREIEGAEGIELSNAIDISITDTGPGIDQKEYKNIFKRFYQVGKDNKDYYGSTGIGLEMVKSFTKLNKGSINVKSIVGKGTTFILSFPLGKSQYSNEEIGDVSIPEDILKQNTITTTEIAESNSLSTIKETGEYALVKKEHSLLIVEDNIELRDYLKNELKSTYTIFTAENGAVGFKIAETETPNVILTDVVMPVMDGYELCKNIKTNVKTSHIPLLMLTSKVMTEEKIKGINSGADAYLNKPFDMGILKSTLTQLLTSRQLLFDKYNAGFITNGGKTQTTPLDKTFIEKVLDFIGKNISDSNLGVEILSNEFNLSRSQFYRKIKALTGVSANELIRKIRLEKAKQLLKTGNYNVNEVTYKIGFSSPSYFTKCFKSEYGYLPTDSMK